jgi:large subunit ribosomal protein L7/L12
MLQQAVGGGVVMAAAPAAAEEVEEKTEFNLMLDEVPADKKIAVLKVVRGLTGLGLKEAKELVESAPKQIQEGLAKDAAEDAKKQIEDAGGKVSLTSNFYFLKFFTKLIIFLILILIMKRFNLIALLFLVLLAFLHQIKL